MTEGGVISRPSGNSDRSHLFLLRAQRLATFPNHESGNAAIDGDGNDTDDKIDVAGAFQHLNQLRAHFRATHRPDRHDESKSKIDVAECAVAPGGYRSEERRVGKEGRSRWSPNH